MNCFYFIQDYEPSLPHGSLVCSRRRHVQIRVHKHCPGGDGGIQAVTRTRNREADTTVPFGCDTSNYKLSPATLQQRRGWRRLLAKRTVDRRGYLLARLALEDFHRRHPEQEIHIFGDTVSGWPFPVTNHGSLRPTELNVLYNRTIASLALSFTNISLVAEELMAAGNVPVLNDHPFSRADLSAPHAIWAPATPSAIADGLSSAVTATDIDVRAQLLAETVRKDWRKPSTRVCQEIERVCSPPPTRQALYDATGVGS